MRLLKSAASVGLWTLVSRIFGFIRDAVIAFFLGAGAVNDAFVVAFRLPNLFRTIFGEGAFSAAFVPMFGKIKHNEGEQAAKDFAKQVQIWLLILTVIFSAIMMYFMPEIIKFTMLGYAGDPQVITLATDLGRITFPYIIFMAFMAFYGGILNSLGKFFAFASAPVFLSIVQVIAITLAPSGVGAGYALSYGALVAGFIEMMWVYIFLRRAGFAIAIELPKLTPHVKQLMRKILPGLVGSSIAQVNVWVVSTLFASFVPAGISYLYYADRIYQLPLALIGTALGTVILASMSKVAAAGNRSEVHKLQNSAIVLSMVFTFPAAFGIFAISENLVRLLFGRGVFDDAAVAGTASALMVFSIALPAFVLSKVFSNNFFALGDTKTPVKIAFVALLINAAASWFLLPYLKHIAIAFGAVLSAYFTVAIQYRLLAKSGDLSIYKSTWFVLLKVLSSCIIMALIIMMMEGHSIAFYYKVTLQVLIGAAVYFTTLALLGVRRKLW